MEVQFSPEQEAQLSELAAYNDTRADLLVKQAALQLLKEHEEFHASVQHSIEQADRGELLEHEVVKARIMQLLQAR